MAKKRASIEMSKILFAYTLNGFCMFSPSISLGFLYLNKFIFQAILYIANLFSVKIAQIFPVLTTG